MSLAGPLFGVIRVARPRLRSKYDKVAFAVHSYLLTQGYKLVATGAAAEDEAADFVSDLEEVDASGWDSLEGSYAFRYQDTEGRRPPLYVKCLAVGPKLLVHWVAGAGKDAPPQAFEVDVAHFTTDAPGVPKGYRNAADLVGLLEQQLGGAPTPTPADAAAERASEGAGPSGAPRVLRPEEKEEEEVAEPRWRAAEGGREALREGPARHLPPGVTPSGVGYEDVVPPGFHPPGFGPGPGVAPWAGEGPHHPGGGMLVGPGHPMFGPGKLGGGVGMPPDRGSLPPGAKWDPIGPPGTRGFHPDDFKKSEGPPKPHPDIMQPGPGGSAGQWDSFYG